MTNDIIARLRLSGQKFVEDSKATFSAFNRDAIASADQAKRHFESSFSEINALAQKALQLPRNAAGSLDLDTAGMRTATQAAQAQATALREIASAAERAATGNGDNSQATRLYVAAAQAAAREAEGNVQGLNAQILAMERLQAELNQTKTAVLATDDAMRVHTRSMGEQRAAAISLGQQATDFSVQVLSGQSAMVAFAQQAPQAGLALAGFEGKLGKVGAFLTGPWGIALTIGVSALGIFGSKLLEIAGNASAVSEELGKVKFASDSLGDAQNVLGRVLDLTTGKIKDQTSELVSLGIAQAKVAQAQAEARAQAARGQIDDLGGRRLSAGNSFGGGISVNYQPDPQLERLSRRVLDAQDNPSLTDAQRQKVIAGAVDELQVLQIQGKLTAVEFAEASAAVAGLGVELRNIKVNQSLERLLRGEGTTADRQLLLKPKKAKSTKAASNLAEFGMDASDRIANLAAGFGDAPSQVEKARKALLQLSDLVEDIREKKPLNMQQLLADAARARDVIENGINRPFEDYLRNQRESLAVQGLVTQGRFLEADALRDAIELQREQGQLSGEQLSQITAMAAKREQIARQIEDERRQISLYTSAVGDAQRTFEQFLYGLQRGKGGDSFKDLGKNLIDGFRSLNTRLLSEKLFGGLDRELQDMITGQTGIQKGGEYLADQATSLGDTLKQLATTVKGVNDDWRSGDPVSKGVDRYVLADAMPTSSTTADDEIVVNGRKETRELKKAMLSSSEIYDKMGALLADRLKDLGIQLPASLDKVLRKNLGAVAQGSSFGSSIGSLFGKGGSTIGGGIGAIGGAVLGSEAMASASPYLAAYQLGQSIQQPIGKELGLNKYAVAAGGVPGGLIAKLFGIGRSVKYGGSTISFGDGELVAGNAFGNSSKSRKAASASADSIIGSIEDVLGQLGATLVSAQSLTVGVRHGDYRVNTSGTSLKKDKGAVDFDGDEQAAIEYAIQQMLSGAVIDGISEASKRILQSGQDLEDAVTKAGLIEAVPKNLKAILDPLGAAIDAVNEKWKPTVDALREGGASAEQMAQAQQLYNLELDDAKNTARSAAQTLKDFYAGLKLGSSSPLSLRDQEATAKAALDPFIEKITNGTAIDQSAYQQAAQAYLDIERQLYGSTEAFFTQFDKIQALTSKAIERIDNAVPVTEAVANPFAEKTATSTAAIADMTFQTNQLLAGQQDTLNGILQALQASGGSAFIAGSARSF
jgi:hypothetical protein